MWEAGFCPFQYKNGRIFVSDVAGLNAKGSRVLLIHVQICKNACHYYHIM